MALGPEDIEYMLEQRCDYLRQIELCAEGKCADSGQLAAGDSGTVERYRNIIATIEQKLAAEGVEFHE